MASADMAQIEIHHTPQDDGSVAVAAQFADRRSEHLAPAPAVAAKVWFDEWVLKPGDSILAKIEEGLEHSRLLVLCMSANAFGSDWAQLEAGTFRFRDPLNKDRRFTRMLKRTENLYVG